MTVAQFTLCLVNKDMKFHSLIQHVIAETLYILQIFRLKLNTFRIMYEYHI